MLFSSARDIPDLVPLLLNSPTIASDMHVDALHEYLLTRPDVLCMPVLEHKRLAGVISTRDFIKRMSQQYVRELARRKTVADFMGSDFFQADASDKITDVLARLIAHDPRLKTDSIVVSRQGQYCGTVPVATLMLALSTTQKHLIEKLDTLSQRLTEEVRITADLQQQLLPQTALEYGDWRVCGRMDTSTEVGGDLFDYFMVDNRYLVAAIGDASGHGVPAGMLVAAAKATLHSLPTAILLEPHLALRQLNQAIMATASTVRLMTFFYMVIDTEQHVARYANAAQNFPLYYRATDNIVEEINDAAGIPLGLDEDSKYTTREMYLAGGDRILFYTDGLIEEESTANEPFGYERTQNSLLRQAAIPAETFMSNLYTAVMDHSGKSTPEDDVTLMVLDLAVPHQVPKIGQFAYTLLKAGTETKRCSMEILLRQRGLQLVDGVDTPADASLFGVPLMTQAFYNSQTHFMPECTPGEHPILLSERPIRMQIANLRANGIARVLNLKNSILHTIGLEHLIRGRSPEQFLSMSYLFQNLETWTIQHTNEKEDVIERCMMGAEASGFADKRPELTATVALLVDEMLENAFLALPEHQRERLAFTKGATRPLLENERVEIQLGYNERLLGIAITDYWGSFEPSKLLAYFERHRYGGGIVAGEGGAGLYLLWRFADYLHIHERPGQQTTFFIFFEAEGEIDPELDKSFQLTVSNKA